jgi:hypothetical protein
MGIMDKAVKTLQDLAGKGKEGVESAKATAKSNKVQGALKDAEKQAKGVVSKLRGTLKGS